MLKKWKVSWDAKVHKQIFKLQSYVVGSFFDWVEAVESEGMENARRLRGYHDEKLLGEWEGFRSVRLTKAFRVIYYEIEKGEYNNAQVVKVSKHEYKK